MTEPMRTSRGRPRGQPAHHQPDAAGADTSARWDATGLPTREQRYLVAAVPAALVPPSVAPIDDRTLLDQLRADPDVHVVRTIERSERAGRSEYPQISVVQLPADRAAQLVASARVHIEVDHPIGHGHPTLTYANPAVSAYPPTVGVTVEVVDTQGSALADATVSVIGKHGAVHAVTGSDGRVTLAVPVTDRDQISGILVRPARDAWSRWQARPVLSADQPQRIVCTPIAAGPGDDWPRQAIGLDRLPPTYLGHGVRVAIIDSGCAGGDLVERVADGLDVLTADTKAWRDDLLGCGTHAAGVVIGVDQDHPGLAPEAEVHICKADPGGHYSDLIDSLDYCITHDIDVAHLGVGGPHPSWLVGQKIDQARRAGVAVIAATGEGDTPTFPAGIPTVLSVGAIGLLGTFPPDSHHATLLGGTPGPQGFFLPRFGAYPQNVDVWAPGVAVVSAATTGGRTALDASSVAAAHVTALAALVLAHHPEFRDGQHARGPARVDHLLQVIRAASRPLALDAPGPIRLATLPAEVGLHTMPTSSSRPEADTAPPDLDNAMGQLEAAMRSAGLLPSTLEVVRR
jgi:subtilisin